MVVVGGGIRLEGVVGKEGVGLGLGVGIDRSATTSPSAGLYGCGGRPVLVGDGDGGDPA